MKVTSIQKKLYLAITINLVIALLLLYVILGSDTIAFIIDFLPHVLLAMIGLFFVANRIAPYMEKWMHVHPKWSSLIGAACALLILLFGTICGATVGFITDGLQNFYPAYPLSSIINDYYFKPLFWILCIGAIPTVITGAIIGKQKR